MDNQPIDFRYIGLHRTAGYILGVDPSDLPPRLDLSARRVRSRNLMSASRSRAVPRQNTGTIRSAGWRQSSSSKPSGYRVLCIDKAPVNGFRHQLERISPTGPKDFTGDIPLQERVNLIKDADFFHRTVKRTGLDRLVLQSAGGHDQRLHSPDQ